MLRQTDLPSSALRRGVGDHWSGRLEANESQRRLILSVYGQTFVVQGEPERRDPDRLVWTLDVRPA